MRELETVADLCALAGQEVGASPWLKIDQRMIDLFAEATGDQQWIHVDVERARREMPDGLTIGHGYLTLALLPRLASGIYRIRQDARRLNYGSDKVRFTAPVQVGAEIRLVLKLIAAEPVPAQSHRLRFSNLVEIRGHDRPALVAETLMMVSV